MKAPISACLIVKNDPLLEKALLSIRPFVKEICIVSTGGSSKETMDIIKKYADKWEVFTKCNDKNGLIEDFSMARNRSFALANQPWLLFMDSDDEIIGADQLKNIISQYNSPTQIMCKYEYAFDANGKSTLNLYRERLFFGKDNFEWKFPVHETVCAKVPVQTIQIESVIWKHNRQYSGVQLENGRNLRILEKYAKKNKDPRTLYYLGQEQLDNNQHQNAINTFIKYLDVATWDDEKMMACLRLSMLTNELKWAFKAIEIKPEWAEGYFALARLFYEQQNWAMCVELIKLGLEKPITQTLLFINPSDRAFDIHRYYNFALNKLGRVAEALDSCNIALSYQRDAALENNKVLYLNFLKKKDIRTGTFDGYEYKFVVHSVADIASGPWQTAGVGAHPDDIATASWWCFEDELEVQNRHWHFKKDDVVLDVGACYGSYALTAAAQGAKVYAIELVDYMFSLLQENIDVNSFSHLLLPLNVGVYSQSGYFIPRTNSFYKEKPNSIEAFAVKTLDDIVKDNHIDRVDMIKIDIEGAELEALKGAEETIKKYKPRILIEEHECFVPGIGQMCLDYLVSLNVGYSAVKHPFADRIHALYSSSKYKRTKPKKKLNIVFALGDGLETWNPDTVRTTGIGGSELMAMEMAKRLASFGHNVSIYSSCGFKSIFDLVYYYPTQCLKDIKSCDIFIASRDASFFDLNIKASRNLLWVHDTVIKNFSPERLAKVDKVLALSQWHKTNLINSHQLEEDKVIVTRNGIDINRFRDKGRVKERYRCINSSSPDRGWPILLECWPEIKKQVPEASLHLFYGFDNWLKCCQWNPALKPMVDKIISQYESVKHLDVFSHGRVNQERLAEEFLKADAWLFPTFFTETSCISCMEAQAANCKIITTNLAALSETGIEGILLDPHLPPEEYKRQFIETTVNALRLDKGPQYTQDFSLDNLAKDWQAMLYNL